MITKLSQNEDFTIVTKGGGKISVPNVVTEPQFNPTAAYAVNAKVWYGSIQYVCTTATTKPKEGESNPTPEEDPSHWLELGAEEFMTASSTGILPFSNKKNYSKNAVVLHDGCVWVCSATHNAGQWNEGHFTKTQLLVNNAISPSANIAIGNTIISNSNYSVGIGTGGTSISGNGNVAIGINAKVDTYSAMQLGSGENKSPKSLKFRDTEVVGGDGKIPTSSLRDFLALESVPDRTILSATAYVVGDALGDNGKAYKCIESYTSAKPPVAPSSDAEHWVEVPVLKATYDQLDDKLDKSGGEMTPTFISTRIPSGKVVFGADAGGPYIGMAYGQNVAMLRSNQVEINSRNVALAASPVISGNIAALDESGNPVDSQIAVSDVVTETNAKFVRFPVYNGQNQQYFDDTATDEDDPTKTYKDTGTHRWTATANCIAYFNMQGSPNQSVVRIVVNDKSEVDSTTVFTHTVYRNLNLANKCVCMPLFLNANDKVYVKIADNALASLTISVFYI